MYLETLSRAEAAGGKLSAFAEVDTRTQPLNLSSGRSEVGRAVGDGELGASLWEPPAPQFGSQPPGTR